MRLKINRLKVQRLLTIGTVSAMRSLCINTNNTVCINCVKGKIVVMVMVRIINDCNYKKTRQPTATIFRIV